MKVKRFVTMVVIILIIAISSSTFAAEEDDTTYVAGRAVIKVTETFAQIDTGEDGIIETEKEWFNQLADQYEIYELKKVFQSNLEIFRYYYVIEFPDDYSVLDVCEDFKTENEVKTNHPQLLHLSLLTMKG